MPIDPTFGLGPKIPTWDEHLHISQKVEEAQAKARENREQIDSLRTALSELKENYHDFEFKTDAFLGQTLPTKAAEIDSTLLQLSEAQTAFTNKLAEIDSNLQNLNDGGFLREIAPVIETQISRFQHIALEIQNVRSDCETGILKIAGESESRLRGFADSLATTLEQQIAQVKQGLEQSARDCSTQIEMETKECERKQIDMSALLDSCRQVLQIGRAHV